MNKTDALSLLKELKAPAHLLNHALLVSEVASQIVESITAYGVDLDRCFVEAGAVLHDTGKIKHTQELYQQGNLHEAEGEKMLLALGVDAKLARVCVSHASWSIEENSLEELLIALSDKLWKGKRVESLEEKIITTISSSTDTSYWDVFTPLDSCFESIAAGGDERLSRSVSY